MNPQTLETPTVCSHCKLNDGWILHKLKYRGAFCGLCTNCVLKLHTSYFCSICFSLYDRPKKQSSILAGASTATEAPSLPITRSTISCFKCESLFHTSCIPQSAPKSPYLCTPCLNPNFKFFEFRKVSINDSTNNSDQVNEQQKVIDLKASKAFLISAKIVDSIMKDEAEIAQAEAERNVKELVMSKKKVKDALENVALISAKEASLERRN